MAGFHIDDTATKKERDEEANGKDREREELQVGSGAVRPF